MAYVSQYFVVPASPEGLPDLQKHPTCGKSLGTAVEVPHRGNRDETTVNPENPC